MLNTSLLRDKFHQWDKDTLQFHLDIDGVDIPRIRPAYINSSGVLVSETTKVVRVLVDIIAFRLNYPDLLEEMGLTNQANANNRDIITLAQTDIKETDEVELDGYRWEAKKVLIGTPRVYKYCVITRSRPL